MSEFKDRIKQSGLYLIYQQGYHATGIKQITDKAGIPKGSFYNYFSSKEEFLIFLLDEYEKFVISTYETVPDEAKSCIENLKNVFDALLLAKTKPKC